MERVEKILGSNGVQLFLSHFKTEPLDEIHLPSLALGLVLSLLLKPTLNLLLGSLLTSVLTLIKFLLIIVVVFGMLMLVVSRKETTVSRGAPKKFRYSGDSDVYVEYRRKPSEQGTASVVPYYEGAVSQRRAGKMTSPQKKNQMIDPASKPLAKEDFDSLKHYDIPITKTMRTEAGELLDNNDPYENFVHMAKNKSVRK